MHPIVLCGFSEQFHMAMKANDLGSVDPSDILLAQLADVENKWGVNFC